MKITFDSKKQLDTNPIFSLLVQGENMAESIQITGPKKVGSLDLSKLRMTVRVTSEPNETMVEKTLQQSADDSSITLMWDVDKQFTSVAGHVQVMLIGYGVSGEVIKITSKGIQVKEDKEFIGTPPESGWSQVLSEIQSLAAKAESAADQSESAADRAESAADRAEKVPTDLQSFVVAAKTSEEEAAKQARLAKDYAEMAQQVSQGAVGFYQTAAALKQAHPAGVDGNWAIVGDTDSIWVWDGDSRVWLDTKTNIKLSDYYTKTESDSMYLGKQDKAQSAVVADSAATATNAQQLGGHTWDDIMPRAVSAVVDASAEIQMPTDTVAIPLKITAQSANSGFTVSGGQIIVPQNGMVMVSMQVMFSAGAENRYVGVSARKNGALALDYYEGFGAKGYGCIASMPRIMQVQAGDKIALYAMHESGATTVKVASSPRTGMTIQYV